MYKVSDKNAGQLKNEPESGVGFQFVVAKVGAAARDEYFVFNAELLLSVRELDSVHDANVAELLKDAKQASQVSEVEMLKLPSEWPPQEGNSNPVSSDPADPLASGRIAPRPRTGRHTVDYEGFVRFSAFSADRRILPNGSVLAGTYASTVADFRVVPSGFAAVGRYALPNATAASFVYMIVPGPGWPIRGGTVRPAFSQAGGGVEVLLTAGAPPGSAFTRPFLIPQLSARRLTSHSS